MQSAMISFPIDEESQVGAARRAILSIAGEAGLGEDDLDRLALVVTEAGTNLVRHAKGGELLFEAHSTSAKKAIATVIALDEGPGIANVEAAMVDGFTTSVSEPRGIGGGLGSMKRQADAFDIHSGPHGTTVVARIGAIAKPRKGSASAFDMQGLIVPKPGFEEGGDAFAVRVGTNATTVMLMDVLGHGPTAASDAKRGLEGFLKPKLDGLAEIDLALEDALGGGRGAAALVVEIPHEPGVLRCIGLGNVKGDIVMADGRHVGIPSQPGIWGHSTRRPRVTEHPWPEGAVLVLSTDGLKSHSKVPEPASLYFRKADIIAATLYKLKRRGSDDAGVLVVRSPA